MAKFKIEFDAELGAWSAFMKEMTGKLQKNDFYNLVVRPALLAAGKYWLEKIMWRHFSFSSQKRYGYAKRSWKWNRLKQRALERGEVVYRDRYGKVTILPRPEGISKPTDLVWTGRMREQVLATNRYTLTRRNTVVRGGSEEKPSRVELRIPIPIPHPLNTKNTGELVKLTEDERLKLEEIINTEFSRNLSKVRGRITRKYEG